MQSLGLDQGVSGSKGSNSSNALTPGMHHLGGSVEGINTVTLDNLPYTSSLPSSSQPPIAAPIKLRVPKPLKAQIQQRQSGGDGGGSSGNGGGGGGGSFSGLGANRLCPLPRRSNAMQHWQHLYQQEMIKVTHAKMKLAALTSNSTENLPQTSMSPSIEALTSPSTHSVMVPTSLPLHPQQIPAPKPSVAPPPPPPPQQPPPAQSSRAPQPLPRIGFTTNTSTSSSISNSSNSSANHTRSHHHHHKKSSKKVHLITSEAAAKLLMRLEREENGELEDAGVDHSLRQQEQQEQQARLFQAFITDCQRHIKAKNTPVIICIVLALVIHNYTCKYEPIA